MCETHSNVGRGAATASRPAASHPTAVRAAATGKPRPVIDEDVDRSDPSMLSKGTIGSAERAAASRPTAVPSSRPAQNTATPKPALPAAKPVPSQPSAQQIADQEREKIFKETLLTAVSTGKSAHDKVAGSSKDIRQATTAKVLRDIALVMASKEEFARRLGDISEEYLKSGPNRESIGHNISKILNELKIELKIRPDFLKS